MKAGEHRYSIEWIIALLPQDALQPLQRRVVGHFWIATAVVAAPVADGAAARGGEELRVVGGKVPPSGECLGFEEGFDGKHDFGHVFAEHGEQEGDDPFATLM